MGAASTRNVRVFRYNPEEGGDGHFDSYVLSIGNETTTTMLDVLLRILREQDPTISFRFACRVGMCGSCGMVINGRERLACRANVSDIPPGKDITLRPLNHFPLIKDLVVDMQPLFEQFEQTLSFYEPKDASAEPALIRPDAPERAEIRNATDCIACGCCVSSCTMAHYHEDYAGPAALARAYALLADKRDALFEPRLTQALASCYNCRTEVNCTEVCPKEISGTRAIKYIQRLALTHRPEAPPERSQEPREAVAAARWPWADMDRATFLRHLGAGLLGAGTAAALLSVAGVAAIGPALRKKPAQWIPVAKVSDLPASQITTVLLKYDVQSGIYTQPVSRPVLVSRLGEETICYNASCPHLGCLVRWDERADQFRCACHGGTFDASGKVLAGPPPRPLDRYRSKIEGGRLLVEVT
ncbi:MAG TPA: 2Fe-2S iron-sulfur cluster-binding protein [Candidatus Acidoferrum sp.]|nr:2Fe-2S iron-sulfur cluster-binding protein [Candidatus Acidoferrum sp.]